jgi:hypothetical protein
MQLSRFRVERLGFECRQGEDNFFSKMSRSTLGPTQSPIQWIPGALFPGVKRRRRETDHSTVSSADVKNGGVMSPLPYMSSWHSAYLITNGETFTLTVIQRTCSRYKNPEDGE